MERLVLPLIKVRSVHIAASITSMRNPNPYTSIFTNSNLFQPNAQVSTCCANDAAMCKSVEKSHPESNEEISLHSIEKLKGRSLI